MSFLTPVKLQHVYLLSAAKKSKTPPHPPNPLLQAVNEGYFPCCSSQDNPLCNAPAPALLWRGKSLIGGILLCSGKENLLTGLSPRQSWLWGAIQEDFFFRDGSAQDESVAPQGREPFSTRGESVSGSTPKEAGSLSPSLTLLEFRIIRCMEHFKADISRPAWELGWLWLPLRWLALCLTVWFIYFVHWTQSLRCCEKKITLSICERLSPRVEKQNINCRFKWVLPHALNHMNI